MSVSGIYNNSYANTISTHYQLTSGEFQQLGQDLAAGNLSSAQSDFAILQQALGATASTTTSTTATSTSSSNPITQALQQLSSDLQSGNLSAAQKDYSTLQQDLQSARSGHAHHHHHGVSGGPILSTLDGQNQTSTSGTTSTTTATQQTFAMLVQQLQQYSLGNATSAAGVSALTNPISFMA